MSVEEQFIRLLREKGYHIATAESCTGGMIASNLVAVSGASDVFEEGYVTYSNRVKEKVLGVQRETIERYTVVSAEVAMEMAKGVHRCTGAEITISVTGYAGPGDAEDGTKAGTVYIGTWFAGNAVSKKFVFEGDRNQIRKEAARQAVQMALERIERV